MQEPTERATLRQSEAEESRSGAMAWHAAGGLVFPAIRKLSLVSCGNGRPDAGGPKDITPSPGMNAAAAGTSSSAIPGRWQRATPIKRTDLS